jgi:hypothetical protein
MSGPTSSIGRSCAQEAVALGNGKALGVVCFDYHPDDAQTKLQAICFASKSSLASDPSDPGMRTLVRLPGSSNHQSDGLYIAGNIFFRKTCDAT